MIGSKRSNENRNKSAKVIALVSYRQLADWPIATVRLKQDTAEAEKQVAEGELTSLHLTEEADLISPAAEKRRTFM
jgi:hypothetical protein